MDISQRQEKKSLFSKNEDLNRFFIGISKVSMGVYLYCLLLSLLYLLLCTKSSPLYPFNDWVDVNAFFTVGKGMMHGLVPYRDLFEQKGPLLYFLYGLASLVSYRTFIGGFILEVIAFSFFLFFSFKSMMLFIEKKAALILLPVMAILILNLKAFTHGGSAEELCLPLVAISLYHLLRSLKEEDPALAGGSIFFWNGLIAGCILWIKFSLLGFWAGWLLAFVINLVLEKRIPQAVKGIHAFLLGMLVATLPWVIYFGFNHAIPDWINTYFVINMTGYPTSLSWISRISNILIVLAAQFSLNPVPGFLLWFGILSFILFKKFIPGNRNKLLLILCFMLLLLGVYTGRVGFIYYYLIFMPFIIFGLIALADVLRAFFQRLNQPAWIVILISATLFISLPLEYRFNQNAYMLHWKQEDLVQYKFASILNQRQNPTLLNYGSLDMGIYTTAGILPNIKYFELQNLDYTRYPLNLDEQNRYIREGLTDFVVLRDYADNDDKKEIIPYLTSNYQLVAAADQYFEGYMFSYYLFGKKDLGPF